MKISFTTVVASLLIASASGLSVQPKGTTSRRAMLTGGAAALVAGVAASPAPADAAPLGAGTPVGREIDTFLSLIYNFKNTDLAGGLDASKLNEESISFIDFGEKMKNGDVTFVEFMAPSGDVAYATFKAGGKEQTLRIGEGYPATMKGGWSSPDYVIRSVSNFGVPYKFTVPGMRKY